jgi:hypothetical protein
MGINFAYSVHVNKLMTILFYVVMFRSSPIPCCRMKPCHEQNPRNCPSFCGYSPLDVGHFELKLASIYGIKLEKLESWSLMC